VVVEKNKYYQFFDSISPGDKIQHWEVLDNFVIYKQKNYYVRCKCTKCNKTEVMVRADNLIMGISKQCKFCSSNETKIKRWGTDKKMEKKYEGMLYSIYNKMKHQASDRNLVFEITIKYIAKLFKEQQGKCKLSGQVLLLKEHYRDTVATASLDRIDSTKGYIEGNVQWVHKDINKIKLNFNQQYFISLCKSIAEHNQK